MFPTQIHSGVSLHGQNNWFALREDLKNPPQFHEVTVSRYELNFGQPM
ncbi:Uncharacterised protein [Acinetobacter baumannii]|nr:Uncharacterised protein [Acinetobacter baumannii]